MFLAHLLGRLLQSPYAYSVTILSFKIANITYTNVLKLLPLLFKVNSPTGVPPDH